MAHIRTVKPEFFRSAELYRREIDANKNRTVGTYLNIRLAFAGLFTACDREGRFRWEPAELKLDCLPHDAVNFTEVLEVLSRPPDPFVVRYEVDGYAYGVIPGFVRHQRPHHTEAPSRIPPPPALSGNSRVDNAGEGKGKEGKGREVQQLFPSAESVRNGRPLTDQEKETISNLKRMKFPDNVSELLDSWKSAYPDVDVLRLVKKLDAWALSKNVRRSPKGWARTMVNALGKDQDEARPRGGGTDGRSTAGHAAPKPGKY